MVNKKLFEELEEALYNSEALIELHNKVGNTTLKINGAGPLLFDGVCTILKELALEENRKNGIAAEEYVRFVAEMVLSELDVEKPTPKEYGAISPDEVDW